MIKEFIPPPHLFSELAILFFEMGNSIIRAKPFAFFIPLFSVVLCEKLWVLCVL